MHCLQAQLRGLIGDYSDPDEGALAAGLESFDMLNNVLEEQSDAAPQVLKPACHLAKSGCNQNPSSWPYAVMAVCWMVASDVKLPGSFTMLTCKRWAPREGDRYCTSRRSG